MEAVSPTQIALDHEVRSSRRQLWRTIILGLLAVGLGIFGQTSLWGSRPILQMLDQAYSAWQSFYVFVLVALGLAWAVALIQQSVRLQEMRERLASQRRLDERYAQRAAERHEAEEQKKREREALIANRRARTAPRAARSASAGARSNKFDY